MPCAPPADLKVLLCSHTRHKICAAPRSSFFLRKFKLLGALFDVSASFVESIVKAVAEAMVLVASQSVCPYLQDVCELKTGPHSTAALMQARPRGARLHDYWQQASKRGAAKEVRFPGFRPDPSRAPRPVSSKLGIVPNLCV